MDGGASLNLLSPEVFRQMQIGEHNLTPSAPFCGVTNGKTLPLGQIELPVTFGGRDNFRTESITFDVVHFDLPYNGILGRPTLAKFMAASPLRLLCAHDPRPGRDHLHQGRRQGSGALN